MQRFVGPGRVVRDVWGPGSLFFRPLLSDHRLATAPPGLQLEGGYELGAATMGLAYRPCVRAPAIGVGTSHWLGRAPMGCASHLPASLVVLCLMPNAMYASSVNLFIFVERLQYSSYIQDYECCTKEKRRDANVLGFK